jgi:uncharacterized protein YndB with AHSA1/START domain
MKQNNTVQESSAPHCVRKVVSVQVPPRVAWRVFTQKMATWWPLSTHKIGKARAVDAIIEARVGGRWYERGDDGSTCDWGRVLVWDPTDRLVLTWEITADWKHDPSLETEVEVRFTAEGNGTRVELEHRRLDLYGSRRDEMRGIFDSLNGWKGILDAFASRAAAEGSTE